MRIDWLEKLREAGRVKGVGLRKDILELLELRMV